jgi:hypothetical protein
VIRALIPVTAGARSACRIATASGSRFGTGPFPIAATAIAAPAATTPVTLAINTSSRLVETVRKYFTQILWHIEMPGSAGLMCL